MELSQLRSFIAAAKTQNITAAAKMLYVTQPTLSASIARLEKELGFKLFDRLGNKIILNESGTIFLNYVERAVGLLDEGARRLRELNRKQEQVVDFSIPHGGLFSVMRCAYIASRPDIIFNQRTLNSSDAKEAILEHWIAFAITFNPMEDEKIEWKHICDTELEIQVNRENPLAAREEIRLGELEAVPFITNSSSLDLMQILSACCESRGFAPKVIFSGDEPEFHNSLLKEMNAAQIVPKLAWLIRPTDYLTQISLTPKNVCLRVTDCDLKAQIGIAKLRDYRLPEAAEDFYSYLCENIAKAAPA